MVPMPPHRPALDESKPPKKKKGRRVPQCARPRRGDPEARRPRPNRRDRREPPRAVPDGTPRREAGGAVPGAGGDAVDAEQVTLDAEIIAGNGDVASFALLMDGAGGRRSPGPRDVVAFDLLELELDGRLMARVPIEERKASPGARHPQHDVGRLHLVL